MRRTISRVAGAPVSWGVNEVAGWGYQMSAERVLGEAASLGLSAIEAGPEGFLPGDPTGATRVLREHELDLVGGFVPVVLHRADRREGELAAAGGEVLIVAASTGREGYDGAVEELDEGSWEELFGDSLRSMRSATGTA